MEIPASAQLKARRHDFNMIYCLLAVDIAKAKNLMFNVIFYVVFLTIISKFLGKGPRQILKFSIKKSRAIKNLEILNFVK